MLYNFQDCVGAIVGIHIHIKVLGVDVSRNRCKREYPTQKVLVVRDFDKEFIYMYYLDGKELFIKNTFIRNNKPIIPGDNIKKLPKIINYIFIVIIFNRQVSMFFLIG